MGTTEGEESERDRNRNRKKNKEMKRGEKWDFRILVLLFHLCNHESFGEGMDVGVNVHQGTYSTENSNYHSLLKQRQLIILKIEGVTSGSNA